MSFTDCIWRGRGVVHISQDDLAWLKRQYLSPLNGIRDIAASMVQEWGYDPAEYPALLDALEAATWESFADAAYEVMREHGLRGPGDPHVEEAP